MESCPPRSLELTDRHSCTWRRVHPPGAPPAPGGRRTPSAPPIAPGPHPKTCKTRAGGTLGGLGVYLPGVRGDRGRESGGRRVEPAGDGTSTRREGGQGRGVRNRQGRRSQEGRGSRTRGKE